MNNLTKNDVYPLLRLVFPLMLMGFVQSSIWFFETMFLARIDQHTLAAGALASWLFGTFSVIVFGCLSSINILVAHKHGAKDRLGISYVARDGLLFAVIASVITFVLLWNISPLFLLFGQSPDVVPLVQSYLHALAWGILADYLYIACTEVIIGIGNARVIFVFTILSVTSNVFFSYVLIFGKLGFPALGIAGAGWGLTVSAWLSIAVLAIYIIVDKNHRVYFQNILSFTKPLYFFELVNIGMPIGIMYCLEVAFFLALTLVMGAFGSEIQAANQIALQFMGFLMSVMFSVAQAVTVRMGHLLGAKDYRSAAKVIHIAVFIATGVTLLAAILYWFYPEALISLDLNVHDPNNKNMITIIISMLAVSALFQIVEGNRIVYFGVLRGLKETNFTLLTSLLGFWCIALPVGYLLAVYLQLGPKGFWWGMFIGSALSVMLLRSRLNKVMTRHLKQVA